MSKSHKLIIDAAFEILAHDPSAPLETIADAAGVSRMTVHRLFNTREALVEAVFDQFTKWGHELVDEAIAAYDDPLAQLEAIIKNGASDGIRFHLLFQIRDYSKPQVQNADIRASAEEFVVKLKRIFDALRAEHIIKPHLPNAWLFYLYTSILHCAWKALKDGVVAPLDVPDFAWESFASGVFSRDDVK